MRDQIIEVTNQFAFLKSFANVTNRREIISNIDGAYWMRVYPPMSNMQATVYGERQLCPWAMAAEITDTATPRERKQLLLAALQNGQKTMRLYDLPANRIMFMEKDKTGQISVWVD